MSFRINTNTQSAFSLTALNKTSNEIGLRQMRLATGSRINNAGDDSAGFTIANKLTAKTRGQAQALSNIGDAKSMLAVAEGSLGSTMDILQTIKEKAVQAGNSSMGTDERAAIQSQVEALSAEVSDILSGAEFNGKRMFSDTAATTLSFQVGDGSGDTFGASIGQLGVDTLGLGEIEDTTVAGSPADAFLFSATMGGGSPFNPVTDITIDGSGYTGESDFLYTFTVTSGTNSGYMLSYTDADGNAQVLDDVGEGTNFTVDGIVSQFTNFAGVTEIEFQASIAIEGSTAGQFSSDLDLTTDNGVASALTAIDAAIKTVNTTASSLGDVQNRLDFKAQNLETSMNNYDAARSRIEDADFAKEQMEIVKLQILQQTGSAMFAQANAAPQAVLSFF